MCTTVTPPILVDQQDRNPSLRLDRLETFRTLSTRMAPYADDILAQKISVIEYRNMKFLIMDSPCDQNIQLYLYELKKHNVVDVVRACTPCYSDDVFIQNGIRVHELKFQDGEAPPSAILCKFLEIARSRFPPADRAPRAAIAVHCVAGLGRAPVLVATALIEAGMKPLDAIEYIRARRRGAFNSKQIAYLDAYKKQTSPTSLKLKLNALFRRKD